MKKLKKKLIDFYRTNPIQFDAKKISDKLGISIKEVLYFKQAALQKYQPIDWEYFDWGDKQSQIQNYESQFTDWVEGFYEIVEKEKAEKEKRRKKYESGDFNSYSEWSGLVREFGKWKPSFEDYFRMYPEKVSHLEYHYFQPAWRSISYHDLMLEYAD